MGRAVCLVLTLWGGAWCLAAPRATFMPLAPKPRAPEVWRTRLRGSHTLWLYAPRKGARLRLRLDAVQVGRYTTEIVAAARDAVGARLVLRPERVGGPPSGDLEFAAPRAGLVAVEVSSNANAVVATPLPPNPWLVVEASSRSPIHVVSRVGRLWFFVPPRTERFTVFARGGGRRENVRLRVYGPDGRLVAEGAARGEETLAVGVEAPPPKKRSTASPVPMT